MPQLLWLTSSPHNSILIGTPLLEKPFTARNLLNAMLGIFFSGSHFSFPETHPPLCSLSRNLSSSDFCSYGHPCPSLLSSNQHGGPLSCNVFPSPHQPLSWNHLLCPSQPNQPAISFWGPFWKMPVIWFSLFLLSLRLYHGDYSRVLSVSTQLPNPWEPDEPGFHSLCYLQ